MSYHKDSYTAPERHVRLKDFDPQYADKHETKQVALKKI